jgi:hypothetical protein
MLNGLWPMETLERFDGGRGGKLCSESRFRLWDGPGVHTKQMSCMAVSGETLNAGGTVGAQSR